MAPFSIILVGEFCVTIYTLVSKKSFIINYILDLYYLNPSKN